MPRRPILPIRGTVKILRALSLTRGGPVPWNFGRVRVTSQGKAAEYDVEAVLSPDGRVLGFTFFKDNDDRYTVELAEQPACECRDWLHRRQYTEAGECKHVKAAAVLMQQLK